MVSVKNLLEFDRVNNEQREVIYKERRHGTGWREYARYDLQDDHGYVESIM